MNSTDIEAATWFNRHRETQHRDTSDPHFQHWWNQSEENRDAYRQMQRVWDLLQQMNDRGLLQNLTENSDTDDSALPKDVAPPPISLRTLAQHPIPWALAAAIACAVPIYFTHPFTHLRAAPVSALAPEPTLFWTTYKTTPYDNVKTIALPDRSIIKMDSDTVLRARLTATRRDFILERGSVEFTVSPLPSNPFEVKAATTLIRALGTVFAVRRKAQDVVEALVTEGRTEIVPGPARPPQKLAAGQAACVAAGGAVQLEPLLVAGDQRLAWLHGKLFFGQGEPLYRAVAEFNHFNRLQLRIVDQTIAQVTVGGVFDKHDPEAFAQALSELDVKYTLAESKATYTHVLLLSRQTR